MDFFVLFMGTHSSLYRSINFYYLFSIHFKLGKTAWYVESMGAMFMGRSMINKLPDIIPDFPR